MWSRRTAVKYRTAFIGQSLTTSRPPSDGLVAIVWPGAAGGQLMASCGAVVTDFCFAAMLKDGRCP